VAHKEMKKYLYRFVLPKTDLEEHLSLLQAKIK